jgi:hypothetical protein
VKRLLELEQLAEEREDLWLEREKNEKLLKANGYKLRRKQAKLREARLNEQYNVKYREEKEEYLRNLEANKAYLNLLN